jgi:hypothetical protein
VLETVGNTPNHNLERAAYFRERYKNLTPTERELRRERLRLYNNTPKRKGSKIEYIRKRRALLADTLSQESIAMESPTYTQRLCTLQQMQLNLMDPQLPPATGLSLKSPVTLSCQLQHRLRMSIHCICLLDH